MLSNIARQRCRRSPLVFLCAAAMSLAGCGSGTPGRMEWVTPVNHAARVGTVYCLRGWKGVFSPGIDAIAHKINSAGGTAVVFMPEQYPELAAEMVQRYRGHPEHEPIVFIGHSRGVDSSLIIARELDKAGISVDLIVCLDSVDEVSVPKNVKVCYNFWMHGLYGQDTNFLRGIPLIQAPGSTGKLYNINLEDEGRDLRGPIIEHISMDNDAKLESVILAHVLEACPERAQWSPSAPPPPAPSAPLTRSTAPGAAR